MTSPRVITHLFLPPSKWGWHHSSAPKQVCHPWVLTNKERGWTASLHYVNRVVVLVKKIQVRAWRGPGSSLKASRPLWRQRAKRSSSLNSIRLALKVWCHLMNTYYIMNYTAQSQTFINTFCTESRRSSENDSQSSNVPGFLKLAWSFKQLPKVRRCAIVHMFEKYRTLFKENLLTFDWNTSVTATPNQVRHGVPPGSAPAAVSQVLRRVWVIRSVTIQISLILLSVSFISSLWLVLFCNRCPYTLSPF